jgi:DNA-binding NarL/FixJ family response regulator
MIRVLIAEDPQSGRESLLPVLARAEGVTVAGRARDGAEALSLSRTLRPDVLLLDLAVSPDDAAEVARRAAAEGAAGATLILAAAGDEAPVHEAIGSGAGMVVLRESSPEDLTRAIHAAATAPAVPDPFGELTEREREVLTLVADGLSNKEIAARLGLTVGTVKGYVSAILLKLGVADRTQAAVYALRHGLVRPEDSAPA